MKTIFLFSVAEQLSYWQTNWKSLLIILFIGAVAGLLAEFLAGAKSFGMLITIILGMAGAWVGNVVFKQYVNLSFTSNPLINDIIYATAGAFIIVVLLSIVFRVRGRDRTDYRA